ncbi:cytochrome c biogenesis protein CcsA [soil metagenome]
MVNTLVGDLGHLSVIIAFVAAIVASVAYFMAARQPASLAAAPDRGWQNLARGAFWVHFVAVLAIIFALFNIIYEHRYEYYYAWSHSSNHLPTHYMISCFWEGQEGSFLLWIFWHTILGLVLMRTGGKWEAPVMAVFSFVQIFLASMILGVVVGDLKIGSSPFILLRDFMTEAPVFKLNPDFVPQDGTGLNPLLQNYWMVIHPPTLFLGFAAMLIPFAFAIAGLWKRDYTGWIKPALPWSLFTALILGVGIMMGAYWAYETLNFGGYWNWDPVENAVYIPWLVLVAGIHTLIAYKRSKVALRTTFILMIASFLLILYATFLTRSGILGNASVHSFTDLGLSGQLFAYMAVFAVLAVGLLVYHWKSIPVSEKEVNTYNGEFWVFIGATVLGLGAFQVLATTSIPVYNAFLGFIGIKSNMALPADQIAHYTKFQLWMGVGIALLSGVGQMLWWQKGGKEKFGSTIILPAILTLLFSSLFILLGEIKNLVYIVILTAALFAVFTNTAVIVSLIRKKVLLTGGAVSHIGVALMLIGILFSAGYSNIVSQNTSGILYSRDFPDEINRDNVLLWRNKPAAMDKFELTYKGQFFEVIGFPDYVNKELLLRTNDEYKAVARGDLKYKDKVYFASGDTVDIYPQNHYYQVEYKEKDSGNTFTLYPRAQVNEQMGGESGLLVSPDIKSFLTRDLYTHLSVTPNPDEEKDWSELKEYDMAIGDTLILNDYIAILNGIRPTTEVQGVTLGPGDVAVQADMKILGEQKDYHAHPVFIIKDRMIGRIPEEIADLGLRLTFMSVDPATNSFKMGVNTSQKDYIILKAIEKHFINVLWIGTCVMIVGCTIAIVRRFQDNRAKERDGQAFGKGERSKRAAGSRPKQVA